MSEFKGEIIKLKKQIEDSIREDGTKNIGYDFFSKFKYKDKSISAYFNFTTVEERKLIIEVLLDSNFKDIMEKFVINLLNNLKLQEKEDLIDLFKGIEHLLTEKIEQNVITIKYIDMLNQTVSRGLRSTILSLIASTIMFILYFSLKDSRASVFLLGGLLSLVFITAISVLLLVFTVSAYHTALRECKKKESNIK